MRNEEQFLSNRSRRGFARQALAFVFSSAPFMILLKPLSNSVTPFLAKGESRNVRMDMRIEFAAGKTIESYYTERHEWLDLEAYEGIVARMLESKKILQKVSRPGVNAFELTVVFQDLNAASEFYSAMHAHARIDRDVRNQLGYNCKAQWSFQERHGFPKA